MNVTRYDSAPRYFPAHHFSMRCVRLQGHEAGPADSLWLGVSTIEPGGYTTLSASALEKHYVVLAGELTVQTDEGVVVLRAHDSCRLAPFERRALKNLSSEPVSVLLAMPFPLPCTPTLSPRFPSSAS
ncbi:cupin domain-containing protein [Paraburkholderia sp. CNPSo 3076]|uniref:cupin domain-containing protein n=1 Tax=Paraburkholderia sp. CNPSo 3076 TaxID=2940936 RepID=UPI002257C96C|nr:cupin domain-containing protein [Paraburkholderia sp. CNPSo 3076]MCX5538293.1 cupin domain-containing protein [Paraburkholderia sp. CNPSo 3076]